MHIFSVTELTSKIKSLLEEKFSIIWINGEISNFSKPLSGHYYFSLKDSRSQISSVMFRGQNRRLAFTPENGMQVTALGRLSVYEPRGTYQIIIEHLEPKGVGALQVAFEQLKEKLQQEGLFDVKHKRPIPFLPQKITVITSPSGAVIHDIIKVATRRFSNIAITVIPVSVQGTDAEAEIVNAIHLLNSRADSDIAIIARGGGSLEDLQAFNAESVARAVFASEIPIVSAVGHETDYTIIDFISDLRAPTPSAAAELVVPNKKELYEVIKSKRKLLYTFFQKNVEMNRVLLTKLSGRLLDPRQKTVDLRMKIDDLLNRMVRAFSYAHGRLCDRLAFGKKRLYSNPVMERIKIGKGLLEQYNVNNLKSISIMIERNRSELLEITGKLHALNPAAILERGYSITRTIPRKNIIKDTEMVSIGENLEVILAKGTLNCIVEGKTSHVKKDI